MNTLMAWLLKYDGYPPGIVFALLMHGLLLWVLLPSDIKPSDQVQIRPPAMAAKVAPENPQRMRRLEQLEIQRQADAQRERERQRTETQARQQREREAAERAEAQRQQQVADAQRRQQAEAEAQRQRDQQQAEARQREEQRLAAERAAAAEAAAAAERQRQQQLQAQQVAEEEAARIASQNAQAGAENDLVSQYVGLITQLISRNWVVPPSARNGMIVEVELRLLPTGEILDSRIVRSSGDAAFDRSALQAVSRVGSFPELQELSRQQSSLFDRNFRQFTLEFRPEDLLR